MAALNAFEKGLLETVMETVGDNSDDASVEKGVQHALRGEHGENRGYLWRKLTAAAKDRIRDRLRRIEEHDKRLAEAAAKAQLAQDVEAVNAETERTLYHFDPETGDVLPPVVPLPVPPMVVRHPKN